MESNNYMTGFDCENIQAEQEQIEAEQRAELEAEQRECVDGHDWPEGMDVLDQNCSACGLDPVSAARKYVASLFVDRVRSGAYDTP